MGSFLSLLELASPLGSPLCAVAEEEGLKEGNLVENEITSHEGGALARDKRNVFFFFFFLRPACRRRHFQVGLQIDR